MCVCEGVENEKPKFVKKSSKKGLTVLEVGPITRPHRTDRGTENGLRDVGFAASVGFEIRHDLVLFADLHCGYEERDARAAVACLD